MLALLGLAVLGSMNSGNLWAKECMHVSDCWPDSVLGGPREMSIKHYIVCSLVQIVLLVVFSTADKLCY